MLRPARLALPLRWSKPRRIFVNSMSDPFHDQVPDGYIARVFAVMAIAGQHTFQVLTKRHGRMRSLLSSPRFGNLVAEQGCIHHVRCQQGWLAVGAMLGGRLRSREPDLARQETYGLLCLYQAIRHLMVAGAEHAGLDPDRIVHPRPRCRRASRQ